MAASAAAITWARIRRHGSSVRHASADVIVVFAAAAYVDKPSPELAARLDHAVKLYERGCAPRILCSGGHPGPNSEPNVMRRALIEAGVPGDSILTEETGNSTRRTLAAVERLGSGRWNRILVVSSPYHMYRIVTEARRLGLPVIASAPRATPVMRRLRPRLRQTLREIAAVWWYALIPARRFPVSAPQPVERDLASVPDAASAQQLACVVLSLANEPGLVEAVRSVLVQRPLPEIVVVNSAGGDPASTLRAAGAEVRLIDVAERLLPGAARNIGIAATSAPIVAFLAADCTAEPGWAAARLAAHAHGAQAASGVLTVAAPRTLSAYASHLLLHHRLRPEAPADDRVLSLVSYDRGALERHGSFREDLRVGEDTDYVERLDPEEVIAWTPDARTAHRYPHSPAALLVDQFKRGRMRARHALQLGEDRPRRRIAARNLRNIVLALNRAQTVSDADERGAMLAAAPLIVLGALACAAGVVTTPPPKVKAPDLSEAARLTAVPKPDVLQVGPAGRARRGPGANRRY